MNLMKIGLGKGLISFNGDCSIFMAINQDIGYDATGRNTNNNELIEIGKKLQKFIAHINKAGK